MTTLNDHPVTIRGLVRLVPSALAGLRHPALASAVIKYNLQVSRAFILPTRPGLAAVTMRKSL